MRGPVAAIAALGCALSIPAAGSGEDAASPCRSERVTRHSVDFLNLDLKEYGWVFFDALSERCAVPAREALERKLEGTLRTGRREAMGSSDVLPFQGWLEGVHVELIHATALVLGGRGLLTPRLDGLVRKVARQYRYNRDPGCDPASTENTCLDDQSQAAAAWAWIGAYERLAGRTRNAEPFLDRAEAVLHESFAPSNFLCLRPGTDALPLTCDGFAGLPAELEAGRLSAVVFNHGFENMGYGVGLMTSFSSAFVALEVAGRAVPLSVEEKAVLRSVLVQGQRGATPDGSAFRADGCYRVEAGRLLSGHPCADLGYRPAMFPVRVFYERKIGLPETVGFRYDRFDETLFDAEDGFLHLGRKAVYGYLGFSWWNPPGQPEARPPLSARVRTRRKPA